MILSIASLIRDILAFKAEGSSVHRALTLAQADLKKGDTKMARERLKSAKTVLGNIRPKDPSYFNKFIKSLGKLTPEGLQKIDRLLQEAILSVPADREWRKPFEAAQRAITNKNFDVKGTLPDLYSGTADYIDEALKSMDGNDLKAAVKHIGDGINLFVASTPLIARNQMLPLP